MPVYRYKRVGLAIKDIKAQVPPADAASVSAGDIGPTQVWDITAPTTSLDDINDFMSSRGWAYVSTDPVETPAQESAGDQDHGELTGLGDDDHSIYHNDTRGDARYYQKTDWSNKAQLDLVTDGDHDVRTDNPHSVTAVQAGAAASTHASQHQHGGSDEVATATPAANAIPKADGSGSLDAWVTGGSGDVVGPASATDNALARFDTTTGKLLQNSPVIVSDAGAMTGVTTYNGVTVTDHNARHESGGADAIKLDDLAAPDDNTDLDASTSKHGLLKKLGGGTTNFLRADGAWAAPPGSTHIFSHKMFQADQMESPVSSNWAVNALAPLIPDASNTALSVRAFDDTTVEGIGFTMRVPTGATNIILGFLSRAASAPGGSVNVGLNLYKRAIPDNSAIPAWGSATALTNLAFTTNVLYQKDSQTIAISTLGLTVGVTYLFELCRNVPTDTLSGDWLLHSLTVGWS